MKTKDHKFSLAVLFNRYLSLAWRFFLNEFCPFLIKNIDCNEIPTAPGHPRTACVRLRKWRDVLTSDSAEFADSCITFESSDHAIFRGVNHSLNTPGNLSKKSEISYTWGKNTFENEKSRTLNTGVINPRFISAIYLLGIREWTPSFFFFLEKNPELTIKFI